MQRIVVDDVVLLHRSAAVPLEDSLLRSGGGNQGVLHALGGGADTLIIAKEEKLIVLDGPAEGASKRVLDEHRNGNAGGIIEKVVGVEVAVAEIVEGVAVELVGAPAGDQLHLRTGATAVLGFAAAGQHAGFFHRIGVVGGDRESTRLNSSHL